MSTETLKGGCQCGAVRYEIAGAPVVVAISSLHHVPAGRMPRPPWRGRCFRKAQVTFTQRTPAIYESSSEARHGFCPTCGTQISFTATYIPGLIDITAGSLDRPDAVAPALHYWDSKRLPWVRFADTLPRHAEFPPFE